MKIGFFTNTYLPINYGSTVSVETFRKGLKKLGEEVFVFAPRHKGYEDNNDFVFRYPSFMYNYKEEYPVAIPFYPPISKKIKELNLDIIHSHQPFSLGKEGLKYAKKQNIPIVFTHHTRYEDYVHYVPILPEDLLTNLVKKEATDFANQCDLVIAPSESIKKMIQSRGVKTKVEVLPTGIDWNKFQRGKRDKIRKKYKIKENELLLLNVGRMEEEKNLEFLFDCLKNIIKKQPHIKLMFVGEGSLKEKLKRKAEEEEIETNILFPGIAKREEIQDFYAAGDVYLQTSTSETQGLSLYEAMASGLPCLAVKSTGAIDAINHNQNGLLIPASKKAFQSEVEKIIINKKLRNSLGQEAVKKAKKNDISKQAEKLKKLYKEVIQTKKRF
ncbi:MAG: glycosyltransferase family 4 protein [Patescibacteria group bacterium]